LEGHDHRNGELGRSPARHGREYLELWMNLARYDWGSLVVIPADRNDSTADIANALAGIGQRLSYGPITAITVTTLEYGSVLALVDLQQHVKRERRLGGRTVPLVNVSPEGANGGPAPVPDATEGVGAGQSAPARPRPVPQDADSSEEPTQRNESLVLVPPARLIISVPPVVTEPLGLAATEEADAVVLAIRLNHSRMAEVKRTIQLVGRERITGCLLVR
jgi:hypothetical protein